MKAKYLGLTLLLSGAILSGCGGGSSSTAASGSTAQTVAISTTNQSTITNAAVNSATQNLSSSGLSGITSVQGSSTATENRMLTDWTDIALQKLNEHESAALVSPAAVVATSQCSTSGTITIDTDGNSTTPYTYLTISYNNCVASGYTTNGTLSLSNLNVTRTGGAGTAITGISAKFAFDITETGPSYNFGIKGGFDIASTGIKTASRSDSFSGTSFVVSLNSKYASLTNFSFVSSYDDSTPYHGHSDTINYTYASDFITAAFSVATTANLPIVKNYGDLYPSSGQITITGANSTVLRVTVVSSDPNKGKASGTVTLELSQDGGATYGSAITKTWSQIAAGT